MVKRSSSTKGKAAERALPYQRFGPPPGQTGLLARSGQPAGAPEAAMASATEREDSHFPATKRMPVTTPPASDARCSMGGAIFSGRINWLRSMDPSSGTIGVSVGPPGTTTLTVMPELLNSPARLVLQPSRPDLAGP